ncbi:acylphosphatase [Rhodocaloribacter litoris]|uniref:acylphosphatase n=1 Tax=Rhodocaloribacter litoris TaxID=2558931 RepID=UPI00141E2701|nr:acylphosphatase [Rhodocaloribacter litoris]QXD16449.1 acylphosphatase [Rhodocaloribacter litoris]GIV59417.1 MAG: acylphosphatase [Rhodothermaceae bacterium]
MADVQAPQRERLSARIEGRVQGVGFRYFVSTRARQLGLTGWVKNEWDGSVRLVAEGDHAALDALLEAVREGPPMARVDLVVTDWEPAQNGFDRFEVRL